MSLVNATILDSETTIFTCANAGGASVSLSFTNDDASARTVTVHARPAGEAASTENTIRKTFSISAADSYDITGWILGDTDVISAVADVASKIVCTATYLNL